MGKNPLNASLGKYDIPNEGIALAWYSLIMFTMCCKLPLQCLAVTLLLFATQSNSEANGDLTAPKPDLFLPESGSPSPLTIFVDGLPPGLNGTPFTDAHGKLRTDNEHSVKLSEHLKAQNVPLVSIPSEARAPRLSSLDPAAATISTIADVVRSLDPKSPTVAHSAPKWAKDWAQRQQFSKHVQPGELHLVTFCVGTNPAFQAIKQTLDRHSESAPHFNVTAISPLNPAVFLGTPYPPEQRFVSIVDKIIKALFQHAPQQEQNLIAFARNAFRQAVTNAGVRSWIDLEEIQRAQLIHFNCDIRDELTRLATAHPRLAKTKIGSVNIITAGHDFIAPKEHHADPLIAKLKKERIHVSTAHIAHADHFYGSPAYPRNSRQKPQDVLRKTIMDRVIALKHR